ncbi:hypothetical protein E2C01_036528 [Portunus trituberculatus]|uniref:Uncharacterized protein n=1 Tax=Portunus trituberculatus TaxID=210409 RepID=A0A5B7FBE8_PORTR|nr:hypothetical protein [Portunus trituberculatus]
MECGGEMIYGKVLLSQVRGLWRAGFFSQGSLGELKGALQDAGPGWIFPNCTAYRFVKRALELPHYFKGLRRSTQVQRSIISGRQMKQYTAGKIVAEILNATREDVQIRDEGGL